MGSGRRPVTVLSLALLGATTSVWSKEIRAEPSDWPTFKDPEGEFELKYPPTWKLAETGGSGVRIRTPSSKFSITFDMFQPVSDAYYDDFEEWTRDKLTEGRVFDTKRLKVAGLSVFTYKVEHRWAGTRTISMVAWFAAPIGSDAGGGQVYALQGHVGKSLREARDMSRVFDQMIRSVRIRPLH
jgi:hypothetical protein